MPMNDPEVIIVGSGKLGRELLAELPQLGLSKVCAWPPTSDARPAIVIHTGSGRMLEEVVRFCEASSSVLMELATGSALEQRATSFPLVLCPNTNILMLKAMNMMANSGALFRRHPVKVFESHQSGKTSVPGTAVSIAQSLGIASTEIVSIRDPRKQEEELGIAPESLERHAYHRIEIGDESTRLVIETRIVGNTPYAAGVAGIVEAIRANLLDNRLYHINEFIERGWL